MIFLPNYYSEVPLQVQQAKRLGINVPFLGSDSWGSPELLKLGGRRLRGLLLQHPLRRRHRHARRPRSSSTATSKIYGDTPDDVAALTYDAFGLLFQALKNAGKTDREAVRDALAKIPGYEGVTGDMQFQEGSGDPIKSAVILQIKGGKFVFHSVANP